MLRLAAHTETTEVFLLDSVFCLVPREKQDVQRDTLG